MTLDGEMQRLVRKHGVHEVLAALCREVQALGMHTLFNKLNRVYEWLKP